MGLRFHSLARRRLVTALLALAILMASAIALQAEPRMWRDPAGKFRFKAELIELGDGFVRLKKSDGSTVRLSFDDLSAADRLYLAGTANPAEPPRPETPAPQQPPADKKPVPAAAPNAPAQALPDLVERVEQSVVRVYSKLKDGEGQGSGVLIDDAGHIVTNHHVVEGSSQVEIEFHDGTKLPILGCCRWNDAKDVAILLVDRAKVMVQPLPLLDGLPRKGEHVLTIGAPHNFDYTVAEGNISAVRTGKELAKISPACQALAGDSHWVQTTAAISRGNSGGPLVDMQGRVVGLNTWGDFQGQNLNFAISSQDVLEEFKKIDGDFVPLPNAPAESIGTEHGEPVYQLPSGTVVDIHSIFIEGVVTDDLDDLFPKRIPVWLLSYNSGRPKALAMHNRGKLHGRVLGLYETGLTATIATYDNSSRHGNLLTWTPTGQKSVFAQYARGKLHGILCRFKDDNLSLVQEYKAGQLASSHLVAGGEIVKNYVPADMPAELDEEFAAAHTDLEAALASLAQNEAEFRKEVMKTEQQFRRLIASVKSVDARNKIQSREDERRATFGGAIADLQKRMGTRP